MITNPHRYFWIVFLAFITSCGIAPTQPIDITEPVITATSVIEMPTAFSTPTLLPTFTPLPPLTATYFASLITPTLPTPTAPPTPAPIQISKSTEKFPLDNLRMAYIVDGNLYVQDGSNSPKQLSNSVGDIYPSFSDDGEKIVFYRGKIHDNNSIFSINADGSFEQEIITTAWLTTLGAGTKAGHLVFVPNAHQILFNTYLCPKYDPSSDTGCTVGLFLVDTDTGIIKEIVPPTLGGYLPIGGDSRWLGNFSISPDGKLLAVAHAGQIDIVGVDGEVIHHNIMEYLPGMLFELYPKMYWLSDSSGLIAVLPIEIDYRGPWYSGDPNYTIWRYTFDGNVAAQITLDPPPSWMHMESNDVVSISPNREWIVYFANDCRLYKGNLLDGSTELLLPCLYFLPMQWSSDNRHFGSGSNPQAILGSVDGPLGLLPGYFIDWIDAKRFIYFPSFAENTEILVGEINKDTFLSYKSNVSVPPNAYVTFTMMGGK